ncbi:MAG: DUF1015 domain-containing protein [Firmicutes bacterium]|nr:DUF1015 domain-containing protein [Bacillota bacterium]
MAEIRAFAAYRYNASRLNLERVLTQPYDKITPEMQARYYALDPYNLVRIEKGRPEPGDNERTNVYTRAAATLESWIAEGILVRDPAPALYAYFQEYVVPGTDVLRHRRGFIALGRVEDYEAGVVHRHEQTLAAPKADRLELLRTTRVQTGQLFLLFSDPHRRVDQLLESVSRVPAPVEVRDEYGVVHRLWPIVDEETIQRFVNEMADKKLVIADGHHRYETALAYRNERRQAAAAPVPHAPYEFAMMTFFNADSEGITILPTHRVIANLPGFEFTRFRKQLEPYFDWYAYPASAHPQQEREQFRKDLMQRGATRTTIGICAAGAGLFLFVLRPNVNLDELIPDATPAQRRLDVMVLHRLVLEKGLGITPAAVRDESYLTYEREMDKAIAAVENGSAQLACLLNPVRVEQVMEIALSGNVLPQKSTDFYPKLLSGLTMYRLEE